jgi:hypothetical protein
MVRASNPSGARFSAPVQTGPGAHPAYYPMGTWSFPGIKNGRGVTLTPHPLLVLWSWMSRAIPLLSLCAVRPVQSLSACAKLHFTFTFTTLNSDMSVKTVAYLCTFLHGINSNFYYPLTFYSFNTLSLFRTRSGTMFSWFYKVTRVHHLAFVYITRNYFWKFPCSFGYYH